MDAALPVEQGENWAANAFIMAVEKVTILKGRIPSDPVFWEIQVFGETLRLEAGDILSIGKFNVAYMRAFNVPTDVRKKDWDSVLKVLSEIAEVTTAKEESENVYIANQVFEQIRQMMTTDDPEDAATGKALLEREDELCLLGSKVKEIVTMLQYRIAENTLSQTMTDLGLKKPGTQAIRAGGKRPRFWRFYASKLQDNEDTQMEA